MSEHRVIRPYSPGPNKPDGTPCAVAAILAGVVVALLAYALHSHFNPPDEAKTEQAAREAEKAAADAEAAHRSTARVVMKWVLFAVVVVVAFVGIVGSVVGTCENVAAQNSSNAQAVNFFTCLLMLALMGGFVWAGFWWHRNVLTG